MERNFDEDLQKSLLDPESAAYFANAQAESERELLRCGVIKSANFTSLNNKTGHSMKEWGLEENKKAVK